MKFNKLSIPTVLTTVVIPITMLVSCGNKFAFDIDLSNLVVDSSTQTSDLWPCEYGPIPLTITNKKGNFHEGDDIRVIVHINDENIQQEVVTGEKLSIWTAGLSSVDPTFDGNKCYLGLQFSMHISTTPSTTTIVNWSAKYTFELYYKQYNKEDGEYIDYPNCNISGQFKWPLTSQNQIKA